MHVYPAHVVMVRDSFINDQRKSDERERVWNGNALSLSERAASFIFPPTSRVYSSGGSYDYPALLPRKRHSFGRKQHWDVYFGRRR